jgi:hypothetical protein
MTPRNLYNLLIFPSKASLNIADNRLNYIAP